MRQLGYCYFPLLLVQLDEGYNSYLFGVHYYYILVLLIYWGYLTLYYVFNSIKQRTDVLQRGLADRSTAVAKECIKLMKDEWLEKSCNGNSIQLLKFLDVETYESVGALVMTTLLKAGLIKLQNGQSIQNFVVPSSESAEGLSATYLHL